MKRKCYPLSAGSRGGETSDFAARVATTKTLARQFGILKVLRDHGEAAPEKAAVLLELDIVCVRPRFSELRGLGLVEKTGETDLSAYGMPVRRMRLVTDLAGLDDAVLFMELQEARRVLRDLKKERARRKN